MAPKTILRKKKDLRNFLVFVLLEFKLQTQFELWFLVCFNHSISYATHRLLG